MDFRFVLILLLLLALLGYVGWHLWMLPPAAAWLRWLLVVAEVVGVGLAVLALTPLEDRLPMPLASFVYNVGNKALIVVFYLFMLFLLADLLRLVHVLPTSWVRDNWWSCVAVATAMAVLFVYAHLHYEHKQRVELTVDTDGRVERPLKVVALSDLHLGYHNHRTDLERWVAMVNAEKPDFIVIAGDLIDRSLRPLLEDDMAAALRSFDAPVYASLGNHEYYAGYYDHPADVERFFADAGIVLLRDSVVVFGNIVVIGRDDRSNPRRRSLGRLMEVVESQSRKVAETTDSTTSRLHDFTTPFTILLDHQPYHLEESEQAGIGLQVSGHTHRGQVWPLSWITDALYECSWGTLQKGTTRYYVSSGMGIWGAKYRIGTQSEYVVINLI